MPLRVIQTVINDALNINFLLQHLFYNKTPFKYTHFPSATSNEMEMSGGGEEGARSLDKQSLIFTLAVGDASAVKNGLPPNGARGHASSLSGRPERKARPNVGHV